MVAAVPRLAVLGGRSGAGPAAGQEAGRHAVGAHHADKHPGQAAAIPLAGLHAILPLRVAVLEVLRDVQEGAQGESHVTLILVAPQLTLVQKILKQFGADVVRNPGVQHAQLRG